MADQMERDPLARLERCAAEAREMAARGRALAEASSAAIERLKSNIAQAHESLRATREILGRVRAHRVVHLDESELKSRP